MGISRVDLPSALLQDGPGTPTQSTSSTVKSTAKVDDTGTRDVGTASKSEGARREGESRQVGFRLTRGLVRGVESEKYGADRPIEKYQVFCWQKRVDNLVAQGVPTSWK